MLAQMASGGFTLLAENAPREIVLGMLIPASIGRVWRKDSALEERCTGLQEFRAFNRPEFVRVVTNLYVEDTAEPGFVTIRTETRCQGLSRDAFRQFNAYWRLIRPFSGLIRIVWLRGIRRRAERHVLAAV